MAALELLAHDRWWRSMRVFDIYDASKRGRKPVAQLVYDGAKGEMHISISEDATPSDLPLMLGLLAEKGQREVPDKWARRWVEERIPPRGRQNLGEILRAQGLDDYDEIELLASAEGRSAQDDFLIREVPAPRVDYAVVALDDQPSASESPARGWCAIIGPKIASYRRSMGLTQQQLAEKTGIDQAAISRIESGRANPTLNTLDALAEGVGASLLVKII